MLYPDHLLLNDNIFLLLFFQLEKMPLFVNCCLATFFVNVQISFGTPITWFWESLNSFGLEKVFSKRNHVRNVNHQNF